MNRRSSASVMPMLIMAAAMVVMLIVSFVLSNQAVPASSMPNNSPYTSPLVISEVMPFNQGSVVDSTGIYSDWCEIYNASDETINLSRYGLTNDVLKPGKWAFPAYRLEPGAYVVVWLADKKGATGDDWRTDFKISNGKSLFLCDSAGNVLDRFEVTSSETNLSYGRTAENPGSHISLSDGPSPGYPNTPEGRAAYVESITIENSDLILNEAIAKNNLSFPDENGLYHDWIELYNRGTESIMLENYGLSDNPAAPMAWRFPPVIIEPGQYMVIYASGQDKVDGNGRVHTSFKLNAGGETLVLSDSFGRQLDKTTYQDLPNDASWAREEGTDQWDIQIQPTPEQPNTREGALAVQQALFATHMGLYISEVCSNNTSNLSLDEGAFPDWIELHNSGSEPIPLEGYGLSDDPSRPMMWRFPEYTLEPGAYLVVYATSLNKTEGDAMHTTFSLSKTGEMVCLASPDRVIMDYVAIPRLQPDVSYGRLDGLSGFFYYGHPTPGAPNEAGFPGYAPDVALTLPGGIYTGEQTVSFLPFEEEGVTVRYTTDGSIPTESSPVFEGPLLFGQTTPFRVRSFREGYMPSEIQSETYIIDEGHTLPVISLVTEPDNMFGHSTGIYADGPNYQETFPHGSNNVGANFWMDWERPVHVEMYTAEGERMIAQDAGIKINGQYSRAEPQKSFAVIARNSYGDNRFRAKLFANREYEEYQSFVLRSTAQDHNRARMRDVLQTSLYEDVDVDTQAYQPVVVYINGQYWGHYNLRERVNKHFVAQHQGYENPDDIDLIKGNKRALNGTNEAYLALLDYVKAHDLNDSEALNYVKDRVDIQNYFDYQIAEIFFHNTDTGNIKFYCAQNVEGAKWRWVLFDLDWGFTNSTINNNGFNLVLNPKGNGVGNMFDNTIIRKLLAVPEMRQFFLERLSYHMNNTFTTAKILARIDEIAAQLEPEMARHYERWPNDGSVSSWERQVNNLRDVAEKRPGIVLKDCKAYFNLSDSEMRTLFNSYLSSP